ncbi:MAG: hypothetical protein DMG79_08980 [Acidobacteria bacterium]|nr:MAG: hypothetical protein DMG79_08980 [Acidobacteriota bacterium]
MESCFARPVLAGPPYTAASPDAANPAYTIHAPLKKMQRGLYLSLYSRKFALLMFVCTVLLCAALAHAQQFDVAVGGSTLSSTRNTSASLNYLPPAENGGAYPAVSLERIFKNHYGYSAEIAFRYRYALYNYYQQFRPLIYDVNAVYAPHLAKKTAADLMAGVGAQTVLFYKPYGGCYYSSGCPTRSDSTHFLMHIGGGIHYNVWRNIFIRPEAHYYYIVNNTADFHSNNVLRLGASIGYTFHRD